MDGPVLSGGVVLLVAAALWMLYLLPSWMGRYQYDAAERNAVRLNQALRVLAETSETPQEVRLELNARTALAQQKLAKRLQSEQEAAELVRLREELAAAHADPVVRQARARRNTRFAAFVTLVIGVAIASLGVWQLAAGAGIIMLVAGCILTLAAVGVLQRMAQVARHAAQRRFEQAAPVRVHAQPQELHDAGRASSWTPRPLPEPLVARRGSLAQATQAGIEARRELAAATREAQLRERAEQLAPPEPVKLSPYARVGVVDDAEIEAHVRQLLAQRAAS